MAANETPPGAPVGAGEEYCEHEWTSDSFRTVCIKCSKDAATPAPAERSMLDDTDASGMPVYRPAGPLREQIRIASVRARQVVEEVRVELELAQADAVFWERMLREFDALRPGSQPGDD